MARNDNRRFARTLGERALHGFALHISDGQTRHVISQCASRGDAPGSGSVAEGGSAGRLTRRRCRAFVSEHTRVSLVFVSLQQCAPAARHCLSSLHLGSASKRLMKRGQGVKRSSVKSESCTCSNMAEPSARLSRVDIQRLFPGAPSCFGIMAIHA